jgi:hypothetical protein
VQTRTPGQSGVWSIAVFVVALLAGLELLFIGLFGVAIGAAALLLGILAYWALSVAGLLAGPVAVAFLVHRRRWILAGAATLLLLPGLALTATALPFPTKAHVLVKFHLQRPLYNHVADLARRGDIPVEPTSAYGRRLPLHLCPVSGTCLISTAGQSRNGQEIIYLPDAVAAPDGDSAGYAHFIGPPTVEKSLDASGCPLYALGDGWWWYGTPGAADDCQWDSSVTGS